MADVGRNAYRIRKSLGNSGMAKKKKTRYTENTLRKVAGGVKTGGKSKWQVYP